MKTLLLIISLFTALSTYAGNYCSILNPQINDVNLEYCSYPKYGITFEGRKISKECYPTFEAAVQQMKKSNSCKLNAELGNCHILHTRNMDKAQLTCPNGMYGITFNGHLKSKLSCYPTLEKALHEMHQTASCLQKAKHEDFKILPPNTYDKLMHACPKYNFGVSYKGVLVNNTCYDSVEKALNAMDEHIKNY
jgi:hypothetical protein